MQRLKQRFIEFSRLAAVLGMVFVALFPIAAEDREPAPLTSSDELYELDNLLKIEIFMEEEDWDKVRYSWRGEEKTEIDGEWVTTQFDYVHQPGDVVINGVRVDNVGIRKKGFFGSLSAQRPSLKLKFNKYVKGQEFLGISDLTLNNNKQDSSQVRQHLVYEWFRRADLPASRCNFARVLVNGMDLGIYSNVEPLGKAFLKTHFGSSKGTLYEGTAVDFQPRAVMRFEAKTNKKTDKKPTLSQVAHLLENIETVDMNELSKLVDLDQFLNFWVAEMLLSHWDGYAGNRNNFFVYQNPQTKLLEFLPWGTDQAFGDHQFLGKGTPKIGNGVGRLCAALYTNPDYRQIYLTTVANRLRDWWNVPDMFAEINRAADLIRPHVHLREKEFEEALVSLRTYIGNISPQVTAELEAPPTQWPVPLPQEGPPKQSEAPTWAGTVKSTFLLPFAQFDVTNLAPLETGSVDIVWRGEPVGYPVFAGTAGYKQSNPLPTETPELVIATTSPDEGRTIWIYLDIDPDLLISGNEIKLHKSQVISWFGTMAAGKEGYINHGKVEGTMRAELVEIDGVEHIKGTIDANLASGRNELEF